MEEIERCPLSAEFASAELGDPRRTRRLQRIVEAAWRSPSSSFPSQAQGDAELEGTYRFLSSEHVSAEDVFVPHIQQTSKRASASSHVVVCHDTTEFAFSGESVREGLGRLRGAGGKQGFFAHYAFAVSPEGCPLGTLSLIAWKRAAKTKKRGDRNRLQDNEHRQSTRWYDSCAAASESLYGASIPVHVMDREADSYELFAQLLEDEERFIIRLSSNRNLQQPSKAQSHPPKLYDALNQTPVYLTREVPISRRVGTGRAPRTVALHPNRKERTAHLTIRAGTFEPVRGTYAPRHLPDKLRLNFVDVQEVDPPEGQPPVHWRLVTTDPIDQPEQVERVVDCYRLRWRIEEFFKAIKTGCAFEKRPLESAQSILVALCIFSAVAWRMLLLRWLDRHQPKQPASIALTSNQLRVLTAVRRKKNKPLTENPSCHDVLMAIAALGGHIKNNGPPGWLILQRGFEKLLNMEVGWCASLPHT